MDTNEIEYRQSGGNFEDSGLFSLKARVSANPQDYEGHIQLIAALKENGDIEELRKAREKMRENFPLTEDLWVSWLRDEISACQDDKDRENVKNLFEIAVQDYQSVKIWLEYCQFRMDIMQNRSEIDEIRKLFERAIINAGLHVSEGASIWEGYRDFESSIYQSYLNFSQSQEDPEILQQIADQKRRVLSLFYRQLGIPHLTLEETKDAFDFWCQEVDEQTNHGHTVCKITSQKLKDFLEIEDELVKTDYSFDVFLKYIQFEKQGGNPARIISIYERAISKNCLYEKLWIDYIDYLISTIKDFDSLINIHRRSLRNLTFSCNLWISYLKTLEFFDRSYDEIKNIFDSSMNIRFPYFTDYLYIRVHFGRYLVRLFNKNNDQNASNSYFEIISQYFQESFSHLNNFGTNVDQNHILIKDAIYIMQFVFRNFQKANEYWKLLISKNSKDISTWMEYLDFLRNFETYKNIRSTFKECLNHKFENPFPVIEKYLQFENLQGDINSVLEAEKLYKKFQKNYSQETVPTFQPLKRHKTSNQPTAKIKKKIEPSMRKVLEKALNSDVKNSQKEVEDLVDKVMSKSFDTGLEDTIQKTKTLSFKNLDPEKLGINRELAVFISNIPYTTRDSEISQAFSPIGQISQVYLVRSANGDSKGYGFLQFFNKESVQKALENDKKIKFDKRRCFISPIQENPAERKSILPHNYNQKLCLYVSKIHQDISEEELNNLFNKTEGFQECRLATYRNGNSRGFAYVQYSSEDLAKKALVLLDGTTLKDKQISIHMSDPPKKKVDSKNMGPNIHFDISEEESKKIEKKNLSNDDFRKLLKNKR